MTEFSLWFALWLVGGKQQNFMIPAYSASYVMVKRCSDNAVVPLFTDEKMVTSEPNPIVTTAASQVRFVIPKSGCYQIFVKPAPK